MAVNRQNPFQQQYIDSFQGKNINSDELQSLPVETYFNVITSYNADDSGNLVSQRKPIYNNSFNDPAPQDFSLFPANPPDQIRIPAAQPVTDAAKFDWSDVVVDDGLNDYADNFNQPVAFDQTSYPYKLPSSDAPEEFYGDGGLEDEGDLTFSKTSGVNNLKGSDTGDFEGQNASEKSVTKIGVAKDAKGIDDGPFNEDITKIAIDPRPNELNVFSSVTYNLALYMLNSRSYIDITNAPDSVEEALSTDPGNRNALLLMRSGGVGLENQGTGFFNDFFIDDLEVTNVATGPSKFKQNTNATDVRFTITEPRGVTLLEKLQDAAASVQASTKEKYMAAPYLLEIKFKGYDEQGRPMPAPSRPKYIPIRITDMQFEVTSSGTQYKVSAIPFAHFTLGEVNSIIPNNIELQATTVGDIFNAGVILETTVTEIERVQEGPAGAGGPGEDRTVEREVKKKKKVRAKNLGEVLTDYQKSRTKQTETQTEKTADTKKQPVPAAAELYDTYDFLIAGEIANAKLNLSGLYDALNTPAPTEESKKKDTKKDKSDLSQFGAYVKGLSSGVTLDKEPNLFKINAGTDISKLINLIILHSDYMDKNILETPTECINSGDPVKWFKIVPVIKTATGPGKGFDEKDGRYKYHITFTVQKSNIYYSDFPWAKKSKPTGNGIHKIYNYIFSGQNTEVLDFDLKFKTAFLQVMTAGSGSPFANKRANSPFSPVTKEIPASAEGNTINSTDSLVRTRAKDLFSSVMTDGVDLVDLNMQIIGDPAYLPTSDAFYYDKARAGQTYTTAFMPDGTINYNLTAPFVQINLRTPVDYNDVTGLANPSPSLGNSSFSGVYRITSVDSTFSGGVFQQRLSGLRAPLQPEEDKRKQDRGCTPNKERVEAELDNDRAEAGNRPEDIYREKRGDGITNNTATVKQDFAQQVADEYSGGDLAGEFDTGQPSFAQQTANEFSGGDLRGEFGGLNVTIQDTKPEFIEPRANEVLVDQFGGNTLI